MTVHFAALAIPSALILASHDELHTTRTYTCKFESDVVVIHHREDTGRADVQIGGEAHTYVFENQKLVATQAGLPTYYFQSELKRWKRLNHSGETVETTVCKTGVASAKTTGSHHD
ncbi:hypothetical protein [Bosea sp. 124]|uniref:hypothetical protein n=1 Tax=Bosea sp. 124 TaxID=2135642 RepID=UPI000D4E56A6|nr:hypothetical protein [Bosea sp. 124]PTM41502.1 hypothetical protein C8D03_3049 [Bosea sp. 124]